MRRHAAHRCRERSRHHLRRFKDRSLSFSLCFLSPLASWTHLCAQSHHRNVAGASSVEPMALMQMIKDSQQIGRLLIAEQEKLLSQKGPVQRFNLFQ